jgi:hypothetical protein
MIRADVVRKRWLLTSQLAVPHHIDPDDGREIRSLKHWILTHLSCS